MYAITYKSKPMIVRRLFYISERKLPYGYDESAAAVYIAAPREELAIDLFLRWIGGRWDERATGIGVRFFEFPCMATGKERRVDSPKIFPAASVSEAEYAALDKLGIKIQIPKTSGEWEG